MSLEDKADTAAEPLEPSTSISPASGSSNRTIRRNNVDFPVPFAPSRATTEPGVIARLTPLSTLLP
jgi:hypothetical protein